MVVNDEGLHWVLAVWKRAAPVIGDWICGVAATFSVCGPDFRVFGVLAVLGTLVAPERRFEPNMMQFPAEQEPTYALIAATSGRMPRMLMTRVRL
jgi:hypothetical protein